MKDCRKFIAIDLGAESGRCIAALLEDQKVTMHEVHRFNTCTIKIDNTIFWNILAIFDEILKGLAIAVKQFGPGFDSIGVDSWGVDYVLIDPDNRILGYPYHYRDSRTDGIIQDAFENLTCEEVYSSTGNQPAQYNTLFQLLAEKKNKLNLLNLADKILLIPDFISYLLTGTKKAEYTIASTTNLTSPETRNWSEVIINNFGFPKNIFPEIVEAGTCTGIIQPWISERTGLNNGIPVIAAAAHDTASAVSAIPFKDDVHLFLSSGTWSLIGIELDKPVLTSSALEKGFTNEGGAYGVNLFLKNIIGLWPLQECKKTWHEEGLDYNYLQLMELAKAYGFVNSWINLEQPAFFKPGNMPGKILQYLKDTGQTYRDEKGFITGVILESLAFSFRTVINDIKNLTGKNPEALHVTGGGIKNELLTQYIADASGLTVYAGPVEGAAIGNAGIQAIYSRAVKDIEQWRRVVENSFEIKIYNPLNKDYFNYNEKKYLGVLRKQN